MVKVSTAEIKKFNKKNKYLICIDSDGCAFDAMDIKWKECFIPALIKCFKLQPIAKYVREEAERINLYSKTRGVNRFAGLPLLFDALACREEVKAYDFKLPNITPLIQWIEQADQLSTDSLKNAVNEVDEPILKQTLEWTLEASKNIEETVVGIPPFPLIKESLIQLSGWCDIAVVSSATLKAVTKEWEEHGILSYVDIICTQEMGNKKQCIKLLKEKGYNTQHIIMLGDALGDLDAAKDNGVLFYPIVPGREVESWSNFYEKVITIFQEGNYEALCENEYIEVFKQVLQ